MTHIHGPSCPGCEKKLDLAHPKLTEWFHRVKEKHPATHVSWAFRGPVDQNRAYQEGKSKLPWPKSEHNHMENGRPCALALDLFELGADGVGRWYPGFFNQLNQENEQASEAILWGGRWKDLGDKDHFSFQIQKATEGPDAKV